ncbi:DUF4157 domain-containing protein [Maribacter halichondriae]|uniref:DUF4157 domain-containing protein n=1 Tax=Maribacter halichondriae TaxID=2980554 RepID=UPI00235823CC|nr:DUF4157 domain-containing protein [Maribacter sp. Hal144]
MEPRNKNTKTGKTKKNKTGLPDHLKAGIENLSGYALDNVKIRSNSAKPAQHSAYAYAQGTDIHLVSGQEEHLPHEAWQVVEQKLGRVKPASHTKCKVNINDDLGLEKEADVIGQKAQLMDLGDSRPTTLLNAQDESKSI